MTTPPIPPGERLSEAEREALERVEVGDTGGWQSQVVLGKPDIAILCATVRRLLATPSDSGGEGLYALAMKWRTEAARDVTHTLPELRASAQAKARCAVELEAIAARPCTCPSGDGSLRWPCPRHASECATPPTAATPTEAERAHMDMLLTGTGFMVAGKRVDPATVYVAATPSAGDAEPWARFDALVASVKGCNDGSCQVEPPAGMHTNGGCRCYRDSVKMQRIIATVNEAKRVRALTRPQGAATLAVDFESWRKARKAEADTPKAVREWLAALNPSQAGGGK